MKSNSIVNQIDISRQENGLYTIIVEYDITNTIYEHEVKFSKVLETVYDLTKIIKEE